MSSAMAMGAAPTPRHITYLWDADEGAGRTNEKIHPELEPLAACSDKDAAVETNM